MENWGIIIAIILIMVFFIWLKLKKKFKEGKLPNKIYNITEIFYPISSKKYLLLKKINEKRLKVGTSPLIVGAYITKLATDRCIEIDKDNILSHSGADDAFGLLMEEGASGVGENLAYGYRTIDSLIIAWFKSESHYRNLMNSNWEMCGIGIIKDEKDRYIYCVLFIKD